MFYLDLENEMIINKAPSNNREEAKGEDETPEQQSESTHPVLLN